MPFIDAEQTKPPGTASTSTMHRGDSRSLARQLGGHDGPQLDHRVVALARHAARAHDDAGLSSARSGVS